VKQILTALAFLLSTLAPVASQELVGTTGRDAGDAYLEWMASCIKAGKEVDLYHHRCMAPRMSRMALPETVDHFVRLTVEPVGSPIRRRAAAIVECRAGTSAVRFTTSPPPTIFGPGSDGRQRFLQAPPAGDVHLHGDVLRDLAPRISTGGDAAPLTIAYAVRLFGGSFCTRLNIEGMALDGGLVLDRSYLREGLSARNAVIRRDLSLEGSLVRERVSIRRTTIQGGLFASASVVDDIDIEDSTIEKSFDFGGAIIVRNLRIDRSVLRGQLAGPGSLLTFVQIRHSEFGAGIVLDETSSRCSIQIAKNRIGGDLSLERVDYGRVVDPDRRDSEQPGNIPWTTSEHIQAAIRKHWDQRDQPGGRLRAVDFDWTVDRKQRAWLSLLLWNYDSNRGLPAERRAAMEALEANRARLYRYTHSINCIFADAIDSHGRIAVLNNEIGANVCIRDLIPQAPPVDMHRLRAAEFSIRRTVATCNRDIPNPTPAQALRCIALQGQPLEPTNPAAGAPPFEAVRIDNLDQTDLLLMDTSIKGSLVLDPFQAPTAGRARVGRMRIVGVDARGLLSTFDPQTNPERIEVTGIRFERIYRTFGTCNAVPVRPDQDRFNVAFVRNDLPSSLEFAPASVVLDWLGQNRLSTSQPYDAMLEAYTRSGAPAKALRIGKADAEVSAEWSKLTTRFWTMIGYPPAVAGAREAVPTPPPAAANSIFDPTWELTAIVTGGLLNGLKAISGWLLEYGFSLDRPITYMIVAYFVAMVVLFSRANNPVDRLMLHFTTDKGDKKSIKLTFFMPLYLMTSWLTKKMELSFKAPYKEIAVFDSKIAQATAISLKVVGAVCGGALALLLNNYLLFK
jgi:hypothetical protein